MVAEISICGCFILQFLKSSRLTSHDTTELPYFLARDRTMDLSTILTQLVTSFWANFETIGHLHVTIWFDFTVRIWLEIMDKILNEEIWPEEFSGAAYGLTVVVISLVGFYCVSTLAQKLLPRAAEKNAWKWKNISISLVHSVISGVWSCFWWEEKNVYRI